MKKKEFNIGDKVKIVNLNDTVCGGHYMGKIGHVGEIIALSKNVSDRYKSKGVDKFYTLKPYIRGLCWPASCLELVEASKIKKKKTSKSNNLFSLEDI